MDWLKAQAKDQYPELAQETHEITTITNAEGKDMNHQVLHLHPAEHIGTAGIHQLLKLIINNKSNYIEVYSEFSTIIA